MDLNNSLIVTILSDALPAAAVVEFADDDRQHLVQMVADSGQMHLPTPPFLQEPCELFI